MRKTESSLLEIFQDPLLTIIALILLGTVWMILPRSPNPVDPKVYADQNEAASLKERIRLLKEKIRELQATIQRLKEKLHWVENQMNKQKEEMDESKEQEDLLQTLLAKLLNELRAKREEVARLEQEFAELQGTSKKSGGGFAVVQETDKSSFFVELVKGRLFPVDEDHYDELFGHIEVEDGKMVAAQKSTRKSYISGEDINKIENPTSTYQKTLLDLNPEETYLVFLLHEDSFQLFRKAREIASTKGFETGWWPHDDESILFVGSGGGEQIGPQRVR